MWLLLLIFVTWYAFATRLIERCWFGAKCVHINYCALCKCVLCIFCAFGNYSFLTCSVSRSYLFPFTLPLLIESLNQCKGHVLSLSEHYNKLWLLHARDNPALDDKIETIINQREFMFFKDMAEKYFLSLFCNHLFWPLVSFVRLNQNTLPLHVLSLSALRFTWTCRLIAAARCEGRFSCPSQIPQLTHTPWMKSM